MVCRCWEVAKLLDQESQRLRLGNPESVGVMHWDSPSRLFIFQKNMFCLTFIRFC